MVLCCGRLLNDELLRRTALLILLLLCLHLLEDYLKLWLVGGHVNQRRWFVGRLATEGLVHDRWAELAVGHLVYAVQGSSLNLEVKFSWLARRWRRVVFGSCIICGQFIALGLIGLRNYLVCSSVGNVFWHLGRLGDDGANWQILLDLGVWRLIPLKNHGFVVVWKLLRGN